MKIGFILMILILCFSIAYAVDTETVGEATYTWVAVKSDPDVFMNARTALENIGFKNTGDISGAINLVSIAEKFCNSYGGVLLWESHGAKDASGKVYIAVEKYPYNDEGYSQAVDRAQTLMSGAYYSNGDLDVIYLIEDPGYWVCLTDQGISNKFYGNNAIALIAACYGGLTCDWGARARVGYNGSVESSTAETDMSNLVNCLTAQGNDYSKMTVSLALQGTQVVSGDANTALIP